MSGFEYYDAKVYKIIQETPKVRRFFLEFTGMDTFDFKAGQYVKVDMPIEGKKTYRQYSIASEPVGDNRIELLIVLNDEGAGTGYLFNEISEGSVLKVSKALGRFVLPESIDRDICFICTGVGLAPFRSMYLDVLNKGIPHGNMHLIFGTRHKEDLCYAEELSALETEHPEFHYHPVLSRAGEEWQGRRGYVHEVYKEIYTGAEPAIFYICGWDNMIKEARRSLMDMGYERREILFEKYD